MKKLFLAVILGASVATAHAQVNYRMQVACHPQDVKTYDTQRLRSSFLMEKVMVPDEINVTYSMYDRFIFGGAGDWRLFCHQPGTRFLIGSQGCICHYAGCGRKDSGRI